MYAGKTTIEQLLPIGSVVHLKDTSKDLMVVGVCQRDALQPDLEYDYLGVLFPQGFVGTGSQFFFNADAIEAVVFTGCQNDSWKRFLGELSEHYNEQKIQ